MLPLILLGALAAAPAPAADAGPSMPHLRRQGTAVQLIVDGQPFLVRGGELGNSSASNPAYLEPFRAKFAELNMNTVLAPVYWDLVEPEEGQFDFSTLDRLVEDARTHGMSGNPLFVPEALRSPEASVNALYALGAHDAMGFSPFGIESIGEPAGKHLAASYDLVAQLEPLLVELQGRGRSAGLRSEGPEQRQPQQVRLGDWVLEATFERGRPPSLADGVLVPTGAAPPSGGLVLATGPDELIVAGTAVTITFAASVPGKRAGILSAEGGRFVGGRRENVRWLNGDQTHQGRHVRLEPGRFSMQRVKLYLY